MKSVDGQRARGRARLPHFAFSSGIAAVAYVRRRSNCLVKMTKVRQVETWALVTPRN